MMHDAPVRHVKPLTDTPFNNKLRDGHRSLRGHEPDMLEVSADGTLWHRVRLCCGQQVPATCKTWEEMVPDVPVGKQGADAG